MAKRPPKSGTKQVNKNILLVDGNSLFKVSYHGAKYSYNKDGEHIGGIYQFITHLRKLLNENIFHNVYVFWDGNRGGKLRWDVYNEIRFPVPESAPTSSVALAGRCH